MEFKDYKEMNRDELKKLYQNLCEINRNVEYDYKDRKSELEKLYKEKERLLETKKQIEYLNNSNSMKLDKSLSAIVTLLSTGALGYCLHLSRNFSNSPEEVIALAISSLTLFLRWHKPRYSAIFIAASSSRILNICPETSS